VLAQSQHVAFPFTVFEVVALGQLSAAGRSPDLRRRVVECLEAVDLIGYEGRYFQQLSGGEQQRVHIARVLCQIGGPAGGSGSAPPRWLFLDEPTQSLDIAHQLIILDLARRHIRAGGGALAILHDLNLASLYADRLIVIRSGNIAADGAPESVLTDACVRSVFGERVRVLVDAANGRRYVLPSEQAA
jgi:iron complex transport system ATP-binding protein